MARDVAIVGGGSWGTALAIHLARAGSAPALWVHDPLLASRIARSRDNATYLPGHPLPETIDVTSDLHEAVRGAREILMVVPSHHTRAVLEAMKGHLDADAVFCVASKGIENDTLLRVSEVLGEVLGTDVMERVAVLSGPSFAAEVAAGHPTAVVVGATDVDLCVRLQRRISFGSLRVYTNADRVGVELGGALKNVIAIGAGAVEGLGHGSNTLAALITRGLAEISRLAEALGGRRETLAGLAGLGDLVLTCTGKLSRNRALGVALGRGRTLDEVTAATPMVAEGVRTTLSAHRLAAREGVDMPITAQVHALLYEGKRPADAIAALLTRELRSEGS